MTTPADTAPVRIQRKRTKGWRMPPNTVYVGRPTKWGNPFIVGGYFKIGGPVVFGMAMAWSQRMIWNEATDCELAIREGHTLIRSRAHAVDWFRRYLERHPPKPEQLAELRGKDIACWCSLDQPCHADVLLEIANR